MTWLVVALVAIVLIAVGAYVMEKQRSTALQRRFGPEYERVLGEAEGNRRTAEGRLRERLAQRDALDLHELDASERGRYAAQWQAVQVGFVDDPSSAVRDAEALVEELVNARGYVATVGDRDGDGGARRYELLAVDHPTLVERYRTAREAGGAGGVDDLREAFLHHRALFQALVAEPDVVDRREQRVRGPEPVGEVPS